MLSKTLMAAVVATAFMGASFHVLAQVPAGYPADYAKTIDNAKKEG